MPRIWRDDELSMDPLKNETVAVVGYGIQGQAQASNMRDSGLDVIVGLRKGGKSWEKAENEGHRVMEVAEAAAKADVVHVLIPDMEQARVYKAEIQQHMTEGKALCFSHGAAIHWKWIEAPKSVDIIMLAPKSPGQRVREVYLEDFGVPALVAVHQDATGRAWDRILAISKGVGCSRAGVIETTFKEEVESDWFGEQVDLCGGVDMLVRSAFETLVEGGYQPEVAYFECLHELKLIVDLIQRYGISGMYRRVSETARYGGLTRGGKALGPEVKAAMRNVLADIRSGAFAKEWEDSYEKEGTKAFQKLLDELDAHPIEQTGRRLRKLMWPTDDVS
ncbi:MAG: ketol-acid reductoisomerase [Nitrososphaerota archaeon]|nr:ketol-acid reductoisomerase [Nitrososphaerota archaeon]MDG6940029.1 ketol-acid reductoisomerase [Nitrososphaerota archaeon]